MTIQAQRIDHQIPYRTPEDYLYKGKNKIQDLQAVFDAYNTLLGNLAIPLKKDFATSFATIMAYTQMVPEIHYGIAAFDVGNGLNWWLANRLEVMHIDYPDYLAAIEQIKPPHTIPKIQEVKTAQIVLSYLALLMADVASVYQDFDHYAYRKADVYHSRITNRKYVDTIQCVVTHTQATYPFQMQGYLMQILERPTPLHWPELRIHLLYKLVPRNLLDFVMTRCPEGYRELLMTLNGSQNTISSIIQSNTHRIQEAFGGDIPEMNGRRTTTEPFNESPTTTLMANDLAIIENRFLNKTYLLECITAMKSQINKAPYAILYEPDFDNDRHHLYVSVAFWQEMATAIAEQDYPDIAADTLQSLAQQRELFEPTRYCLTVNGKEIKLHKLTLEPALDVLTVTPGEIRSLAHA